MVNKSKKKKINKFILEILYYISVHAEAKENYLNIH